MSADITNFLSKFSGFARPNRFLLEFSLPKGITATGTWLNTESTVAGMITNSALLNGNGVIQISCHTCTMPARTLMTHPHVQHGAPFRVPYSQQYEPVTFSFYSGRYHEQRHFFEIWQTAVVNLNDNSFNFLSEYCSDIDIWQLDRNNNKTYGVRLYNAWPMAIGELQYNYGENSTPLSITVTMEYKLWKNNHDTTTIYPQ